MASPLAITDLKTLSGLSFAEVELPVEQDKNINRNPISEVTPYLPVFMEKSTSAHTWKTRGRMKPWPSGLNNKTVIESE